jgi:hypothetical protein
MAKLGIDVQTRELAFITEDGKRQWLDVATQVFENRMGATGRRGDTESDRRADAEALGSAFLPLIAAAITKADGVLQQSGSLRTLRAKWKRVFIAELTRLIKNRLRKFRGTDGRPRGSQLSPVEREAVEFFTALVAAGERKKVAGAQVQARFPEVLKTNRPADKLRLMLKRR